MISRTLASPDILILQEIMDDDGRMDSQTTSAEKSGRTKRRYKTNGGAEYLWFNIDPLRNADGGVNGGNIRVVILYRLDRG